MKTSYLNIVRLLGFTIISAIVLTALPASAADEASKKASTPKLKQLKVGGGQRHNGIFDASVEYGDDGIGWLAYSSINIPKFVEVHLAKSTDKGKTWSFVAPANTSKEGSVKSKSKGKSKGKSTAGVWRYETPSLLFDPSDKPERRWKLYSNRYFTADPFKPVDRHLSSGTISVQHASSPDGTWSKPECVVGNGKTCKLKISTADASLANAKSVTEPGTILEKGVIYMSLDTSTTKNGLGEWENYRVVLLASKDHGESWRYVGNLLDHKDAMKFKYLVFTGTSLVREQGKLYLMATPSGATHKKRQDHDGTMVIEIANLAKAKIVRDEKGVPVVVKRIEVEKQSGGLADYDEQNTGGGIVFPQFTLFGVPEVFQVYSTGQSIAK